MRIASISNSIFAAGLILTIPALQAKPIVVKDPLDAMQRLYNGMESDKFDLELPLSVRLRSLTALDSKETGRDEVGRLDFDYFVNGQDSEISAVRVTSRSVDNAPGRRIVVVRFKNFGEEMENHYFWERTKTGWVLDDVRYLHGDDGYTLSLVLKYGWDGPEKLNEQKSD